MTFYTLWVLAAIYCTGLCTLFYITKHNRRWYALAKGVLSCLFVLAGLFAYNAAPHIAVQTTYFCLMAALFLCAGGDILLGVANLPKYRTVRAKPFLAGSLLFLSAHILFCVAFYQNIHFSVVDLIFPVLSLISMWVLETEGLIRLKGPMRFVGYLYAGIVALMAGTAVRIGLYLHNPAPRTLFIAGGLLFFLSDVILLFMYFGKIRNKRLRYWNLGSYYIGVFCLAVSAYWL